MSDREMLELAAKAAGLLVRARTQVVDADDCFIGIKVRVGWNDRYKLWNPLSDDGDALRLAVNLRIDVVHTNIHSPQVHAMFNYEIEVTEDHGSDPLAATRRAIVRAAAKIGRRMP
jgi:hypothetical protein